MGRRPTPGNPSPGEGNPQLRLRLAPALHAQVAARGNEWAASVLKAQIEKENDMHPVISSHMSIKPGSHGLPAYMGDATEEEARALRDLLVEHFDGLPLSEVPDAEFERLMVQAVQ